MTVCIGALCEGGKAAVLVADEMVTFGPPMSLQTEPPGLKKIVQITDSIALCYAGSVPDGEDIIGTVRRAVAGANRPTVEYVAEQVRAAYEQLKQRRVEETILRPWLGANFTQFQELIVKASASQILAQVMGMVSQHNLQTDMLVAGSDDSGHHLFIVTHPSVRFHMNTMGYATIGSGAMHAGISLALTRHTVSDSLERALYRVYEAKKAAEVSPGVGRLTDIAIIKDGKFSFVTNKTLDALAKVHKEHPDLAPDEQKGITESFV
jgi:20S proteasome alpha/beta subunit